MPSLNTLNALSQHDILPILAPPPSLSMASASSPCHRLLPPSSSPSLDPCFAVESASHSPDLPFSMTEDAPAAPPPAADGSSLPEDDPRPSPLPAEPSLRKTRFPRACTSRSPSAASVAAAARPPQPERRPVTRREKEQQQKTGRVITPLVEPPLPPQLPRWELRSMWELASIFNFLHVRLISCCLSSFSSTDISFFARSLRDAVCFSVWLPRFSDRC